MENIDTIVIDSDTEDQDNSSSDMEIESTNDILPKDNLTWVFVKIESINLVFITRSLTVIASLYFVWCSVT